MYVPARTAKLSDLGLRKYAVRHQGELKEKCSKDYMLLAHMANAHPSPFWVDTSRQHVSLTCQSTGEAAYSTANFRSNYIKLCLTLRKLVLGAQGKDFKCSRAEQATAMLASIKLGIFGNIV